MLEEKDIEILLKAKKDRFAINALMALSFVSLGVLIFLEIVQIRHDYTILLATISAVFMGSSAGGGANKWVSVSREDLIKTLENIVSRDPNALRLLAMRRKL